MSHIIAGLRAKRVEIAALVHDTEKKLAKLRGNLANLDAAINILTPGHPDAPPPRRAYRQTRYFARKELSRLVQDSLRTAGRPVTARDLALAAITAKGLPESAAETVTDMVLTVLRALTKRGDVAKAGTSRDAKWAVA
jgi:hypothetical protein